MDYFQLIDGQWFAEGVPLAKIADQVGTPCYVYSKEAIEKHWQAFEAAFGKTSHQINYAVKANSNLAVLSTLASLGSGFDIVSGGELARVLTAKGDPKKIVFSGVGKTKEELQAALEVGVGCINVESLSELSRLNEIALHLRKKAPIAFRVNPDIDAKSHPYISTGQQGNKFGVDLQDAIAFYQHAEQLPGIHIQGLAFHIGSQITTLEPFLEAIHKMIPVITELKKLDITISHLNVGGGLGVCYRDETPPDANTYVNALLKATKGLNIPLHIEPGRAIVANAGVLLTRVEYIKKQGNTDKYFAIVDAAMNDLLRPALYDAWQDIVPINTNPRKNVLPHTYDIVGPVCESGDFLGKDRILAIETEDCLAICSAGAYGFSMSSNYNSRPRVAEVMVEQDKFYVVRKRETIEDLIYLEDRAASALQAKRQERL